MFCIYRNLDESQVVPDDSKTEALPGDTQTVMAINGDNIDAVKISGNDGYKDGDFLNGGGRRFNCLWYSFHCR